MKVTDKTVSCPLMNERGEVLGMIQKSASDENHSFALGAGYGAALSISALSAGDTNLSAIGIPKSLPEDETQALVYLYMASSQMSTADYERTLDRFIAKFPQNAEGYLRRGQYRLSQSVADSTNTALRSQAEADLGRVLALHKDVAEANYDVSRAYSNIGDYNRALTYIEAATQKDGKPVYLNEQGSLLILLGRKEEAIPVLRQTLEADANYVTANRMLGYLLVQNPDTKEEGVKYLQHAQELGDELAGELIKKYNK
jgi:tetratricopeptide (TPR) repeat protein